MTGLMLASRDLLETHYTYNATVTHQAASATADPSSSSSSTPQPPHILVSNLAAWTMAIPLAQAWDIPLAIATFVPPGYPCRDLPPCILCPVPLPFGWMNRLAASVLMLVYPTLITNGEAINDLQRSLGVEVISVRKMLQRVGACPWLLCYSPTLCPTPLQWHRDSRPAFECGALTGRPTADQQPPPPPVRDLLASFLSSSSSPHEPVIFFGWGSMVFPDPAAITRMVLQAVKATGTRAIIQRGWANLSLDSLQPDGEDKALLSDLAGRVLELRESVPHSWLFPQCAVVVHHGGCGTTHTALTSGKPQVVTPVVSDQPFWAYRVGATGVGPAFTTTAHSLTAEKLTALIREAMGERVRDEAAEVGAMARDEQGVTRAIEVVEKLAEAQRLWKSQGGPDTEGFWGGVLAANAEEDVQSRRWWLNRVLGVVGVGGLAVAGWVVSRKNFGHGRLWYKIL